MPLFKRVNLTKLSLRTTGSVMLVSTSVAVIVSIGDTLKRLGTWAPTAPRSTIVACGSEESPSLGDAEGGVISVESIIFIMKQIKK